MKFSEVPVGSYFRFGYDVTSVQKTSPFGYTKPAEKVFGEMQIMQDPEVTLVNVDS